jgi:hypothetical protein
VGGFGPQMMHSFSFLGNFLPITCHPFPSQATFPPSCANCLPFPPLCCHFAFFGEVTFGSKSLAFFGAPSGLVTPSSSSAHISKPFHCLQLLPCVHAWIATAQIWLCFPSILLTNNSFLSPFMFYFWTKKVRFLILHGA